MRVLFVTRKWPPAMGGMETYSIRLSQALMSVAAVELVVLSGRADGSPPSSGALLAFGLRTCARILARRDPGGVVHVADMASWPLAAVARLRSRRWRIALSAHGTDVAYPLQGGALPWLYGAYLRLGARCLGDAVVVANSAATAEHVRGCGFRRVAVSPLGTDMRPPGPPEAPEGFVLFAGRLVEGKGCGWFIREVLPALPEGIALKVAGTVWSERERAALGHPRVEFVGPQEPDALARLYAGATCVVVPNLDVASRRLEGFGLVATEAAACGGIALAAAHSGLRDAVIDGVTGFLLPPGDAAAWIAKVTEIAGWQASQRAAFVARSMAETARYYSWERVAAETLAAYRLADAEERIAVEPREG